jgi:quercetin dioxygenase-like cupin family protein
MEELIAFKGKRFAYIIRKEEKIYGKKFFSNSEDFLQVGYMNLKKSEKIVPHTHKTFKREVTDTQEAIYVISGQMKVKFYEERVKIGEKVLHAGDLIVLLGGAHGFEFLEDTTIFEIKQGPYINCEADKEKFYEVE